MYISHKYKIIFLRTPKTASSSLSEFFIRNIPDPAAIYTPVEDSNIKGQGTANLQAKYSRNFKYYHFTLEDLINEKVITKQQARDYRVISVVRDPVDRQKSFFFFYSKWKARGRPVDLNLYKTIAPNGTFTGEPNSALLQSSFGLLDGEYVGEYWLYENLSEHLSNLMKDLNLQTVHPLVSHKSGFRKNKPDIKFDGECLNKMKDVFEKDFKLYNELKENSYASN